MKRFKGETVVDLAIAANFARELTEEQFAEQRRTQRPRAAANGTEHGSAAGPRESRERKGTRLRRTLGRLAHVRG
jgi:hypothetical protein